MEIVFFLPDDQNSKLISCITCIYVIYKNIYLAFPADFIKISGTNGGPTLGTYKVNTLNTCYSYIWNGEMAVIFKLDKQICCFGVRTREFRHIYILLEIKSISSWNESWNMWEISYTTKGRSFLGESKDNILCMKHCAKKAIRLIDLIIKWNL